MPIIVEEPQPQVTKDITLYAIDTVIRADEKMIEFKRMEIARLQRQIGKIEKRIDSVRTERAAYVEHGTKPKRKRILNVIANALRWLKPDKGKGQA